MGYYMSKFQIALREAHVGKINARLEKHGDENMPATDIPVTFRGTKRDLDMLVPLQEGKFSDLIYSKDGHCLIPHLSPLTVHRKPEGLDIQIFDQATKKSTPLRFTEAKAKSITIELGKKHELIICMTLQVQVDPEAQAARLYRLMDSKRDLKIESSQQDWIDTEEGDGEEEEGAQQKELSETDAEFLEEEE